jgi:hypothetical protein
MKREYIYIFFSLCMFIFFMLPEDNLKSDTLADLTRNQIHNIVRNEGNDCEQLVMYKRMKRQIKIGCDHFNVYKKYTLYKNDFGFNKVRVDN